MVGLGILPIDIYLNEEWIFVDKVNSLKNTFGFVPLEEIPCSMNLAYENLEGDIVNTLSRVVGTAWSEHSHQGISLLVLHLD
jgi:hypothetical protein